MPMEVAGRWCSEGWLKGSPEQPPGCTDLAPGASPCSPRPTGSRLPRAVAEFAGFW